MNDLSIEQAAQLAAMPEPWPSIMELLREMQHTDAALRRGYDVCSLRVNDVAVEQRREWEDIAALRDEVHALAAALVSAGIPLVDPPPLRSVS